MKAVSSLAIVAAAILLAAAASDARRPLPEPAAGADQPMRRSLRGTIDLNPAYQGASQGTEDLVNANIDNINEANAANTASINAADKNNVNTNSGNVVTSLNNNLANLGIPIKIGNGNLGNGR